LGEPSGATLDAQPNRPKQAKRARRAFIARRLTRDAAAGTFLRLRAVNARCFRGAHGDIDFGYERSVRHRGIGWRVVVSGLQ
jgi:hypothetical protein